MKLCNVCLQEKPVGEFREYKSRGKWYVGPRCIDCYRAVQAKNKLKRHHARKSDPVYWAKHSIKRRAECKRRTLRRGGTPKPWTDPESGIAYPVDLLERNARQAFIYWVIHKLSDAEASRYFELLEAPWENPNLSRLDKLTEIMSRKIMFSQLDGTHRELELRGKYAVGPCAVTLVDARDWVELSKYKWKAKPSATGTSVYAVRDVAGKSIRLHREVLGIGGAKVEPLDVDHINGNPLDNRKQNLRLVTRQVNAKNKQIAWTPALYRLRA